MDKITKNIFNQLTYSPRFVFTHDFAGQCRGRVSPHSRWANLDISVSTAYGRAQGVNSFIHECAHAMDMVLTPQSYESEYFACAVASLTTGQENRFDSRGWSSAYGKDMKATKSMSRHQIQLMAEAFVSENAELLLALLEWVEAHYPDKK